MATTDNTYFSEKQAYFHGFGRALTAKGQEFVDMAPMKAGHNLDTYSIRSKSIPFIDADYIIRYTGTELDGQSVFTDPNAAQRTVRSELSSVLKFYDGVDLTVMAKTNSETWQLVDNGNVVAGFVDPTDKYSADGSAKAVGYTMELLTSAGSKIPAKAGQTWAFNAFNGAVSFANGETPAQHTDWGTIKIRAFAYVKEGNLLEDRLTSIEANISGNNDVATSGIEAVVDSVDFISGTILSGFDSTNTVSSAIEEVRQNAALFSLSSIEAGGDYAASYQLMQTINGVTTEVEGSRINIPKDQFLSQAVFGYKSANDGTGEWSATKDATHQYPTLKLTFELDHDPNTEGVQSDVYIPMHDLINDYSAASGVQYNDDINTFSVKIDSNSENFLTVGENGVLLSGVQEAINTAVSDLSDAATAGLTTLSGAASGYLSGNAISNKFDEVDGRLDTDEANITSLTNALSGYTGVHEVSSKFENLENSINSLHNNSNIVSGTVASNTAVGTINNNELTVDVQISDIPGNAIVIQTTGTTSSPTGLWAQAYKAGDGIEFGPAGNDGIIPISATYELPIASTTAIGGIKEGEYIDVDDTTGQVTVKKVENELTLFDNSFTYNGSAAKTLTVGDYISVNVNGQGDAITLDVVVDGEIAANNSGLISGAQVYEVSSNLATAITTASEELSGAISGAYTSGMIVIGDTDKIVASPIKLGTDRTFATDQDHAEFGAESNVAATEASVLNFVNYGLNDLADAISMFNDEVEAIQ